ncbi:hypothetical protein N9K49_00625 [Flavobacteriaceae bacterium]|nr:hypothetical protein [Flavobacteriaceae bacterium]
MKKILLILTLISLIFHSCKNGNKSDVLVEKVEIKTVEVAYKNESKGIEIYKVAENVLNSNFEKSIKFQDFTNNSERKPNNIELFNNSGLKNVRGYLNPKFDKTYISQNFENYTLFIFEFISLSHAEKSFLQFSKDNQEILRLIKSDEWDKPNQNKSKYRERVMKISHRCKSGGIVFQKEKYIINIVKTCREPLTLKKMNWMEYEQIFYNAFLDEKDNKSLILNTNCGSRNYKNEHYENK